MIKEITLGAGCFWCLDSCFKDLKGVLQTFPGYAGGSVLNPSYEAVCNGTTGHAEVVRVIYDDAIISFDEIMSLFWWIHDPTQLNRQGNDIGTQYRSVIFYHDLDQKNRAEELKSSLENLKVYPKPIVTQIVPLENYFEAEAYHHDYFSKNPQNQYCQMVVKPKIEKFKSVFVGKIK